MKDIGIWQRIKVWWNNAKFNLAVRAIFIFAVIVSFSHTMELYRSAGFDVKFDLLNHYFGVDWFNLALFATLAAEMAFAVGLWGLYEAYEQIRKFPNLKEYWQVWTLFGCGLLVVGWSNIGGTVGYDFLVRQPAKGIALGLSIPLFVLGSVLVNFKRKHQEENTNEVTSGTNTSYDISDVVTSYNTRDIYTNTLNTSHAVTSFDTNRVFTRNDDTRNSDTSNLNTSDSFTSYDTSYAHTSHKITNETNTSFDGTNNIFTNGSFTSNESINEQGTSNEDVSTVTRDHGTNEAHTSDNITSELSTSESGANETSTIMTNTSEDGTNETNTSDSNTSKVNTSNDTSDAGTNQKPSNVVELAKHTSKRKRTSRRTTWTEEEYQRVREIALQLLQENPKVGRPTLMEKAGCRENLARRVLDDLKEELKLKQSV